MKTALAYPSLSLTAALVSATLASGALHAQSTERGLKPLEEVVVTSSRIPVPLRQIGTSLTVITAADIEAHGNFSLSDVLRQLPAISVSNAGGAGKPTSLRIRGEEGFRTLIIMDGLRLSDPSAPQVGPHLQHMLSSGINRVEILRGPQGLSYGADAGGVLNISSRSGHEGLQATLDAQSGKFGTRQISATVGGSSGMADLFVSAAHFASDGFNALVADDLYLDRDGYKNDTLHLRGGLGLSEAWRVDLVHRHVKGDALHDYCFSPTMDGHDCLASTRQDASRLALSYQGADFSHSLAWSSTDSVHDNFSSGEFSFGSEGTFQHWEYVGSATQLPGYDLVFGVDLQDAENNGVGRDNVGVYLEYLSDFSDSFHLAAGLRHDDNDDFGTNTSYRISSAYLFDLRDDQLLKFKTSYGTGHRAPSPYEVQYNHGSWAYPPASLVSLVQETSAGWEAGFEYRAGASLRLEAVYFDQQIEDAIVFDPITRSGYLQDLGISDSQGVELSAEWNMRDNWWLSANYTRNDTSRPDGSQRIRRPQHLFNAGLSWDGLGQRLNLNAFLRASRNSVDEVESQLVDLQDFIVLDLSATFQINEQFQLYGRLENALDEQYQEIFGYHTAGRAAYVGFRLSYAAL